MISLKSKIAQKVLNYFFINQGAKKYTNELARLLKVDPKNLDRKLKELEKIGLFRSEFSGKQHYFFLNRNFPLLKEYQKIILRTFGFEKRLADELKKIKGLKAAYVFGSYVKNKMNDSSDIDILLVGGHSPLLAQKMILPIQKEIGREINIVEMAEAEFKKKKTAENPFLKNVLTHSIKII